tara:strand:- start:615 stop:959 length:345 start_codon:yes stop_codon:yes gene_type:complete
MKEHDLHNALVKYIDLQYKDLLYTSTLGGIYLGSNNWKQKNIKKTHYKKGVPDVLIFEPRHGFHGLMLELKTKKGKLSLHQKEWLKKLNKRNYCALTCYGLYDAIEKLNKYLNV